MLSYLSLLESALSEETDVEYEAGRKFWNEVQPHLARDWNETTIPCPTWPLDEAGLRSLERQVFQKPDWLARWAHFDWRSFHTAHKWNYSEHQDAFHFYDVPTFGYKDGMVQPDRRMVTITSAGKLVERKSDYAHFYATLPTALEACLTVVRKAQPKLKLMKGRYFVRFGQWPKNEQSINGLTRRLEQGVSVYDARYDLDEGRWSIDTGGVDEAAVNGTMQSLIYDRPYRPIYLVQGDEQKAVGSDGETLLRNVRLVQELHRHDVFVPGMFDPREDDYDGPLHEGETLELPDLEVGDEVLVGKFKNRKATIRGFDKDKNNQPVLKTDKGEHKLFKPRITKLEENGHGRKLSDLCTVRLDYPEADFWVTRRGTPEEVGQVTKDFNPEHFGVKVRRTDVLLPQYLYYAMMNLCNQGYYRPHLLGALTLKNIGIQTIKNIPLG